MSVLLVIGLVVAIAVCGTSPIWLVCLLLYLDGYSFWAPFQYEAPKRANAKR